MPHEFFEKRNAVHARHFNIQRNDVRLKHHDLVAGNVRVRRRSDNFDLRVAREFLCEDLSYHSGIINHKNLDLAPQMHRPQPFLLGW